MPVPTQQSGDPATSSDPQTTPKGNDPQGGGTTNPTPDQSQGGLQQLDPKTLTAEQLNPLLEDPSLLENPEFWKTDRMKELIQNNQELKKLKEEQQKAADEKLKNDKKFEELAANKEKEASDLKSQLEKMRVDQSLTTLLYKEGVTDLEAALLLIDRSGLEVKDSGIEGTDKAVEKLKTDKAYLFGSNGNNTQLGTSSNGQNGQGQQSPSKFKRSQLADRKFYEENRKEILEAMKAGLIEDDITGQQITQQNSSQAINPFIWQIN